MPKISCGWKNELWFHQPTRVNRTSSPAMGAKGNTCLELFVKGQRMSTENCDIFMGRNHRAQSFVRQCSNQVPKKLTFHCPLPSAGGGGTSSRSEAFQSTQCFFQTKQNHKKNNKEHWVICGAEAPGDLKKLKNNSKSSDPD